MCECPCVWEYGAGIILGLVADQSVSIYSMRTQSPVAA